MNVNPAASGSGNAPTQTSRTPPTTAQTAPSGASFADVLAARSAPPAPLAPSAAAAADVAAIDGPVLEDPAAALGAAQEAGSGAVKPPETALPTGTPAPPPKLTADRDPHAGNPAGPLEAAKHGRTATTDDPLDPIFRQPVSWGAAWGPNAPQTTASTPSSAQTAAVATMEELLPSLVSRVAWSGNGKKGAVRMEFGAGALAGGSMLVEADGGEVHVRLTAPSDADGAAWGERIRERLSARGLSAQVEIE